MSGKSTDLVDRIVKLVVIADAYPPLRTSAAVQIRDLVSEMVHQGHHVTLLLPDAKIEKYWDLEQNGNLEVLRLKAPKTKDIGYVRRAIAEFMLSSALYKALKRSPFRDRRWDALVWYSPSIFFGKLVKKLKWESSCPAYLILRDIFPEWAVDMGLLGKGIIYRYFKTVEKFQYRQADTIGVQTSSNITYFKKEHGDFSARIEVLDNWLSDSEVTSCSINLSTTNLSGRQIFVYTGNIGIAQGMDILIDLARQMSLDKSIGFLFVGRGTAVEQIKDRAARFQLDNILFHDEITPEEIPGLLSQCHAGLIALDPRHRNDNIPGKFLAYMQAGLPVLATINEGNDLETMIQHHQVGEVVTNHSLEELTDKARKLIKHGRDQAMSNRCRVLARERFSSAAAVSQIIASFNCK